ncbi:redoxin domain-containing protein [Tuwongella immobilis]|uniref:Thioredoxin domain-containing protein n=1 Tax=Tuwongella immobilis TaxID=692036 RepID=A0A6C2YRM1_9BACT|nr:redoxin domain-containing protein [Tuwongella immobilis]VIP03532.1 alkyl hydroperoxide reductase thiol specific antioxidant mal allergen : Uncharacterized protein OS=Sandaracinus amylolyticus GN=DB32_5630 PE=4 SV=1: AhpC-TSA [Tuwongella immobilis]VTS04432.1 alkyl hydroperoxide reductase thiol specific antioxidant mal allergen : Uncharacterized protein OS=Sandaracinus amylolyticus GN=DB32_5630 PE=4 SV=1: AhpC-TSA [Tuwongella immobilis]
MHIRHFCWVVIAILVVMIPSERRLFGAPPFPAAPIPKLSFDATANAPIQSTDWNSNRVTVLVFLSLDCPVANRYAPEYRRLSERYHQRGVRFIGVHCEPDTTREQAAKHADEYRIPFPVILDPHGALIRATGAEVVSEVVVLRGDRTIAYRGRLDDRYTLDGKSRENPRMRDLVQTLDALLADKSPPVAHQPAFGCPLPQPRSQSK